VTFRRRARRRDPRRYVFVDEFGINLAMRTHGRAPRGARVVDKVPTNYGDNYTLVYALRLGGLFAPLVFAGAMNGTIWNAYVLHCLAPCLRVGDVVVFDGLGAHRTVLSRAAIARRGAVVEPLPPYSPDLSPIEPSGAKVKAALRAAEARTRRRLYDTLGPALHAVSRRDAAGWFRHCGFAVAPEVNPL
jgi:transposase